MACRSHLHSFVRFCLAAMLAWLASVQSARADGSVVINEISPGDANGSSSWVELHNTSNTETVELGYWRLDAENETTESSYYISFEYSIPPGGYIAFERDTTQLTIARSGTIRLLDPDETVVDQADYTVTEGGAAIARIPDGSSNWVVVFHINQGIIERSSYTNTGPYTHTIAHAIAHAHSNAYTDPYSIANTNTIAYADPYTHSNACTDPYHPLQRLHPTPSPTPAPAPTPTPTPTPASTPMPSPTPTLSPSPTPTPTPTPTPLPTPNSSIVINEIFSLRIRQVQAEALLNRGLARSFFGGFRLQNNDSQGWVELYNRGSSPADVSQWYLDTGADADDRPYQLPTGTTMAPGAFLVFEEATTIFRIFQRGRIRLLDLYGTIVDEQDYDTNGGTGIARMPDGADNSWVVVSAPTKGEPNFVPSPTPSPTPTPTPLPPPRPAPKPPPPTPSPLPTPPLPLSLRITEVYYDGQVPRTEGDEFIEIQNQGTTLAHLARVRVLVKSGQADSPVVYGFYADNVLSPGDIFVIAKNARQFEEQFGFRPSFEARFSGTGYEDTENVRNMLHERDTSRRTWALANTGAVVALIGDHGTVIDAVAYGHDPGGYFGLQGDYPSASGGQSLLRVSTVGVSGRMPSALRADTPSPGIVPPSPTPTLPTPTPIPLPLPTPITPTPSPTPTPTPTPIPPLPTPTPLPTSTPSPTPAPIPPTPSPTPSPTPIPPTPTATVLHCLAEFPSQEPTRLVRVVGTVTEIRELPQEIRVYLADNCGGAVLHLAIDDSAPPVGSQIRVTAIGSLRNLQIDLYVAPETRIENLPGTSQPQAIPFMQAMLQRALTGTRVRSAGNITQTTGKTVDEIYDSVAGYVRLDPHARAVPIGPVVFYGILEWRETVPLLRVHYIIPAKARISTLWESFQDLRVTRIAAQYVRDTVNALIIRSLTRGRSISLP